MKPTVHWVMCVTLLSIVIGFMIYCLRESPQDRVKTFLFFGGLMVAVVAFFLPFRTTN